MSEQFILLHLPWIIGGGMLLGFMAIAGWVFTTWLRIKHGYPLETSWGKALEPRRILAELDKVTAKDVQRVAFKAYSQ